MQVYRDGVMTKEEAEQLFPYLRVGQEHALLSWCHLQSPVLPAPIMFRMLTLLRSHFSGILLRTLRPPEFVGPKCVVVVQNGDLYIADDSPRCPFLVLRRDSDRATAIPLLPGMLEGGCGGIVQLSANELLVSDPRAAKIHIYNFCTNKFVQTIARDPSSHPGQMSMLPGGIIALTDTIQRCVSIFGLEFQQQPQPASSEQPTVTAAATTATRKVTMYRTIKAGAEHGTPRATAAVLSGTELAVIFFEKSNVAFYLVPVILSSGLHSPTSTQRIAEGQLTYPTAIAPLSIEFPGDHIIVADGGSSAIKQFRAADGVHLLTVGLPKYATRSMATYVAVDGERGTIIACDRAQCALHHFC